MELERTQDAGPEDAQASAPAVVTDALAEVVGRFARLEPFSAYVRPEALLVVGTRGQRGPFGRRAACHFTRFRDTRSRVTACGRFELPELFVHGRPILYVISFTFPRYLQLTPREQAEDVVHELLHVDPSFDGAASPLRHGKAYDARVHALTDAAERAGLRVPPLAVPGRPVFYQRLRPFPRAYLRDDPRAKRVIHASDLELALLPPVTRAGERAAPGSRARAPARGA